MTVAAGSSGPVPQRVRYATTKVPSASSAALEEPAQKPWPVPGAGTATTARAVSGSGNEFAVALSNARESITASAPSEERLEAAEETLALALYLIGLATGAHTGVTCCASARLFHLPLDLSAFTASTVFYTGHTQAVPIRLAANPRRAFLDDCAGAKTHPRQRP